MSERYSRYEQLQFDRPHPRVLRIRIASPLKLNAMTAHLAPRVLGDLEGRGCR